MIFIQVNGGSVKRKRDDATSALLTLQGTISSPKKQSVLRQKTNQQKSIAGKIISLFTHLLILNVVLVATRNSVSRL